MDEKKQKIQKLLDRLDSLEDSANKKVRIRELLGRLDGLTKARAERQERNKEIAVLVEKNPKVNEIFTVIESAKQENESRLEETAGALRTEVKVLQKELGALRAGGATAKQVDAFSERIGALEQSIERNQAAAMSADALLEGEVDRMRQKVTNLLSLPELVASQGQSTQEAQEAAKRIETALAELERDMNSRIARIQQHGGGNANRQILVNGSQSTLGYFTDINLIPGSNMGISIGVDQTNKRTNFTFSGANQTTSPAGSNTEIQYNDNGAFGASSIFTWNKSTSVFSVGNSTNPSVLSVNGPSSVMNFAGNFTLAGNATLGDARTDSHTVNGNLAMVTTGSSANNFSVSNDTADAAYRTDFAGGATYIQATNAAGSAYVPLVFNGSQVNFQVNSNNVFFVDSTGARSLAKIIADTRIGIATTAPDKALEVNLGTGDALRLSYNAPSGSATVRMDTTLSSAGLTTFTGVGSVAGFAFAGGKVTPAATTANYASLNLPTGTAPAAPADGDIWREDNTDTGLKIRINGATKTINVS